MLELVPATNYYISLGAILLQIATVVLFAAFILRTRIPSLDRLATWVGKRGLTIAFIVSLFASIMTLFYSEVIGFVPCPLCWWQRVFLYPQLILLGMALYKRDAYVAEYSIVLSFFGLMIALYQHILQVLPNSGLPCPAVGASCSIRVLFEFGYITFPLLAATLFAFLIVVMLIVYSRRDR